jgi:glycosyltransferase involved in cell wall biosynthesis
MHKCIDSLLVGGEQVEIIIIDDGSKDRTGAIADAYAQKYPSIVRVIHQENGGHGEGINQGLKHATGTYFKVVDSDDTLSGDFPAFLKALADCEAKGGVDLAVTNYYYVHTDGIGDRPMNYSNVLPKNKIFSWEDTKKFGPDQMLTIHSCTFRTEAMRKWPQELPKHVFYEDNLMVYQSLPYVQKMFYFDADLYRYWIGRPDQSVQRDVMTKRYTHQLLVTERCFTSYHLDDVKQPKLKKYLVHDLFLMFGIGIIYARLHRTDEADANMEKMFESCAQYDEKWAKHFRYRTPLRLICLPGKGGRDFAEFVYKVCNKIVRYN